MSVKLYVKIQNLFSSLKILASMIIVGGGLLYIYQGKTVHLDKGFEGSTLSPNNIVNAIYSGLWAYDGWAAVTTVAEEIKNPGVNIPRSILIGVPIVTCLYVFMNLSYMSVLSIPEMIQSPAVAVAFSEKVLGAFQFIVPLGVVLATFGCALSIQFGVTRLCYAAGREGHMLKIFSFVHVKRLTPAPAVVFQGLLTLISILSGDIITLIEFTSFLTWIFYGMAMVALILLRYTEPNVPRPYKVPIIVPILVLIMSIGLAAIPIFSKPAPQFLIAVFFIVLGIFVYIPFVYYQYKLPFLDSITKYTQLLLNVLPPEETNSELIAELFNGVPPLNPAEHQQHSISTIGNGLKPTEYQNGSVAIDVEKCTLLLDETKVKSPIVINGDVPHHTNQIVIINGDVPHHTSNSNNHLNSIT